MLNIYSNKKNDTSILFLIFVIALILRLFLSNTFLNNFYPYTLRGGEWYFKIHPSTYLLFAIYIIVFSKISRIRLPSKQVYNKYGLKPFTFAIILIAVINISKYGTGGMAYFIDTYLVSIISVLLALSMSCRQRYLIAVYIILFIIFNSLVAIWEYNSGINIMFIDQEFSFFRATAFLGHPLNNGLVTAVMVLALIKTPWPLKIKMLLVALLFLSLFAFGTRGALAGATIGLICYFSLVGFFSKCSFQKRLALLSLSYLSLGLFALTVFFVLFFTNSGATISSRLSIDDSIQERFDSVAIIDDVSFTKLFSGLSPDEYSLLIENNPDVNIIENYWIVILLKTGIPLFIIFTSTFFYLLYRFTRQCGWVSGIMVIVFVLVSSTNNSLSSKNAALMILLLVLIGLQTSVFPEHKYKENMGSLS